MTVRAAYGIFYDYPHMYQFNGLRDSPPWGSRVILSNPAGGFDDPWQGQPGGNPFPLTFNKNTDFPLTGSYLNFRQDAKSTYVHQWNLSVQRQVRADWLVSATYLGSNTIHIWAVQELNPGIFLGTAPCTLAGVAYATCSATANLNQRRRLSLENPATGQFFGSINRVDAGATASYNGLVLSLERRAVRGITLGANYTWSHCISDPGGAASIQGTGAVVLN